MNEVSVARGQTEASRRSLLWGTSWMSVYTTVYCLVKIVRGLVVPRLLVPATYGLWSSLSVVLGYTRYADMGVQQQLTKRLPYQLGKEGSAGYWDLASRGITWMTCVTIAVSTGLFVYSFMYQGGDAWFYRPAFRLLALVIVAQNAHALLVTLLVARQEFRIVALSSSLTDVLALITAICGLLTIGVMGLIWALFLAELAGAFYCFYHLSCHGMPRPRWQLRGVTRLIREGLLLLTVALLEQMMMTVDQLFVLRFFPKHEYGLYALGLFIVSTLIAISGVFLTAQPRILELWGAGEEEESRQTIETNIALYILTTALCVAPFLLLTAFMVHFYLVEYAAGLEVFVLMPAIALARGPVILLRSHFLVHNYEKRLIAFQICGLLLAMLLDGLIIWQGWSMSYIVLASTAGYLLTGALMFLDFERGRWAIGRAKYAMLVASLAGVIGVFLFYQYRETQQNDLHHIAKALSASLAYLILIISVFWITRRSWLHNVRLFIDGAQSPLLSGVRRKLQRRAASKLF